MAVLVACKNEDDPIKSGHNIIHRFLRYLYGANSIIGDGILAKFKLIQVFIVVLFICKNEEDPFQIKSTRVVTTSLPLYVYLDFQTLKGS